MSNRILFISRHEGAITWFKAQSVEGVDVSTVEWCQHLSPEVQDSLVTGDVLVGTLPINIVCDLNAKGVRFIALSLVFGRDSDLRGKELTPEDMDELHASLQEYSVKAL